MSTVYRGSFGFLFPNGAFWRRASEQSCYCCGQTSFAPIVTPSGWLARSLTTADKCCVWVFSVACESLLTLTCFWTQTLCRLRPDNGTSVCNLSRAGWDLSQWVSIISGAAEEFTVEFSFFDCLLKSHTKWNLISYIHPADGTVFYNKA